MRTHTHETRMHAHMPIHTHAHWHACIPHQTHRAKKTADLHTHTHTHRHTHTHTNTHTQTHTHKHTHKHMHKHTHTHTNTHTHSISQTLWRIWVHKLKQATRRLCCVTDQKHKPEINHNTFLSRQNKAGCKFLIKCSFSKLQMIQKQTSHLAVARWILAGAKWFICFCIVHSIEEEDFLENLHSVLSDWKAFCLTFCVFEDMSASLSA